MAVPPGQTKGSLRPALTAQAIELLCINCLPSDLDSPSYPAGLATLLDVVWVVVCFGPFPAAIQAFAQDAHDRSGSRDCGRFLQPAESSYGRSPLHNLLKAAEQIAFRRPLVLCSEIVNKMSLMMTEGGPWV
jgi:hypothetical protein